MKQFTTDIEITGPVLSISHDPTVVQKYFKVWRDALLKGALRETGLWWNSDYDFAFSNQEVRKSTELGERTTLGVNRNENIWAVQINEPKKAGDINITSAIGLDEKGQPYLLRQGRLNSNPQNTKPIIGADFRRLTGLRPVIVKSEETNSTRDWYVVSPLAVDVALILQNTANFVKLCDYARTLSNFDDNTVRFWWVNHKQTYKEETSGGYIWSPITNQNGARNQSYDNMAEVEPGDVIFSFAGGMIKQVGVASSRGIKHSKPDDFGSKGANWRLDGWLVSVRWIPLQTALHPKSFIDELSPYLPEKYSPISSDGNGLQNSYLASITADMAGFLFRKIPEFKRIVIEAETPEISTSFADEEEEVLENKILNDTNIDSTEKESLIKARRGQGKFRRNLEGIERYCRFTGVDDRRLLRASHIKPWRLCDSNHERLDGNNGLLLTPTFDVLFDQGYISFDDDGRCLVSSKIPAKQLSKLGVDFQKQDYSKSFNNTQKKYLEFHRAYFNFNKG